MRTKKTQSVDKPAEEPATPPTKGRTPKPKEPPTEQPAAVEAKQPATTSKRKSSVVSRLVSAVAASVGLLETPPEHTVRKRAKKAAPDQPRLTELIAEAASETGEELPVPVWRPAKREATKANGEAAEAGKRSRRRRGRDAGRREEPQAAEPAAAAETAAPEELPTTPKRGRSRKEPAAEKPREPKVEAPKPARPAFIPAKPHIPIPADAPQVVMRDGQPTLVRQGAVYPPLMFFGGASDETRAKTVLDEIRLAGDAGVHLHCHLVEFEVDPDGVQPAAEFIAYLLNRTVEVDPLAQVLFRIVFRPARGWTQKFPNAAFYYANGGPAEPSVCDDAFWGVAVECLRSLVRRIRLLDLKDHVLGLHLDRGEWFLADGWGYDTSEAAKQKFRDWARTRYLDEEVALRASWFDGGAHFESLQIPTYHDEGPEGEWFVRSSRKQRRYVDYHLFLSDQTVARIGDLAYAVKEASDGYLLVGVSYGYTFEWSHPSNGHLSLGKLLRAPEIDFVAGPPSYKNRGPGGSGSFPGPIDSFALNGKLYISEEDFKTAIGHHNEPDDFNPIIKTPQALDSVHWRGAGVALAHGSGASWMDLWGNGWLKTSATWQRGKAIEEALTLRMAASPTEHDVIVFIDERALAYLVDQNAFRLLVQNVRESVLRSGMSAGWYLLSDLAHREHFPEGKLYLFLNAWDIRSDLRAAIKQRLHRDGKVLFWLYAAGLFEAGREALERAREATGIALKPQPFHSKSGTTIINRRNPLCEAFAESGMAGETQLEPSYFAIPEDAVVLGEYASTGLPSFVVRDFKGENAENGPWRSVFLGEPVVTPGLIRALGQMAGAHIWNFQEDVVHVRPPFLAVHCKGAGPRGLSLPAQHAAYNLRTKEWVNVETNTLRFQASEGSSHLFLVGEREELEHLLSRDPTELLKIADLPERPADTVRPDMATFDVPIMKLGEWMESGDVDDSSEDWLLHPKIEDLPEIEEPEGVRQVGRRRRRRRGGDRQNQASKGGNGGPPVDEELGMHVMFRKRE